MIIICREGCIALKGPLRTCDSYYSVYPVIFHFSSKNSLSPPLPCDVVQYSILLAPVLSSSVVWLFVSLWAASYQASLSMGILQAAILEWVALPSSRGSSQPRDWTQVPTSQVDSLLTEPPGKPKNTGVGSQSLLQGIFLTRESNWGLLHYRGILAAGIGSRVEHVTQAQAIRVLSDPQLTVRERCFFPSGNSDLGATQKPIR